LLLTIHILLIFHLIQIFRNLPLEELARMSFVLSHDQGGCRFIQRIIEQNDSFTNDLLFPFLQPNLIEVMNDSFGNYLIQKMIEKLNEVNFKQLLEKVNKNFYMLAKNPQGTRVIQKFLEYTNDDFLKKNLTQYALDLLKDNNGYHIILKYSNLQKKAEFIEKIIETHMLEIATNKFGCCAIQKYLQLYPSEAIIKKIILHTEELIINIYGNYVIQFIISLNDQDYNMQIIEKFKKNICFLSKQKFSSNVIERCFDHCLPSVKNILINYICEEKVVEELLLDMYGNYGKYIIYNILY